MSYVRASFDFAARGGIIGMFKNFCLGFIAGGMGVLLLGASLSSMILFGFVGGISYAYISSLGDNPKNGPRK